MMHRNSRPDDMHYGKWNAPGGKLEPGESPEECVLREVFEETALTLVNPQMKGVLTFPAFDGEESWYVYVFTASQFSGVAKKSCHEGELHWVKDEEIAELPLWEGDRVFMKWLDGKRFFSGKFIYNVSGFQSYSVSFYGDGAESGAGTGR